METPTITVLVTMTVISIVASKCGLDPIEKGEALPPLFIRVAPDADDGSWISRAGSEGS